MTINCLRERKSQAELSYLWQTVRRVSTFFRAEIETIFIEEHLEKMTLFADCGRHCELCNKVCGLRCGHTSECINNIRFGEEIGEIPFTFSHLIDDASDRAVFKLDNLSQNATDEYILHAICVKMGAKDNDAVDRRERIPAVWADVRTYEVAKSLFVMQMRGGLCDGLVGFSVNEKAHEISAQWKGLLSSFFGQKTAAANLRDAMWLPGPRKILWPLYIPQEAKIWSPDNVLFNVRWRRDQVKDWREVCQGVYRGCSSVDKMRHRQEADQQLNIDDEGHFGPVCLVKMDNG